jgi:sec-independent protein translocase protein TatC
LRVNDRQQPMREHLVELRRRITWSAVSVLVCTGAAFAFHKQILLLLMRPAQGFEGVAAGKPIYTEMTEFIGIAMKVSLLSGVVLAMPFVLYQMVMFVAPGLTPSERRYLYTLLPVSLLVFAAGAAFGYRILFPPAVRFLLTFGSDIATPFIRIGNYVNLMLSLFFWMGLLFETPVVLFFLARIGVVTPEWLGKQRRYAVVVAFILGALITPTFDPVNQAMVAIPIVVLYEVGIWLAKIGRKVRRSAQARLELDPAEGQPET